MPMDDRVETERSTVLCDEIFNNDFLINRIRVLSCPVLLSMRRASPYHQIPWTTPHNTASHNPIRAHSTSACPSASGKRVGSGPGTTRRWDGPRPQTWPETGPDISPLRAVDARLRRRWGRDNFRRLFRRRDRYECATANVGALFVCCSAGV